MARSEVLFLGGRSGVGKSSVGNEIHAQLSAARVQHCLIEGDSLDLAYPPPWNHRLAERNLAAMWGNYRELGYRAGVARRTKRHRRTRAGPGYPGIWVYRVVTDDRTVADIAAEVIALTGWIVE
jgi:hypothetical protein